MEPKFVRINYEVFGRVQGVFFRKFTKTEANKLGLVGWVMNTPRGTVTGEAEGNQHSIEQFKYWLRHTGSPSSNISDMIIKSQEMVDSKKYSNFTIRK